MSIFPEILAILAVFVALLAAAAFIVLLRRISMLQQISAEHARSLRELNQAMKVISGEAFHRGQDQVALTRSLERLTDQQHEMRLEMRLRDADHSPYAQAIKLIQSGQSREQVRKLCALTESELDLLFGLHGQGIGLGMDAARTQTR